MKNVNNIFIKIKSKMQIEVIKKIFIVGLVSVILAVGMTVFLMGHVWDVANIKSNLEKLFTERMWMLANRAYIFFFVFMYIGLHFIIPIKKMYHWMFERRWILGIVLLLFLTVNRYHGDSIGYYDLCIQPSYTTEQSKPILGSTRPIRSDEFVVTTPAILASSYGEDAYEAYNSIMRGEKTLNITNGVYLGLATLGYAPQELAYAILPIEYAYSFCWWFPLIFSFLMSIEIFYIISNKKKLLSVAGASLVVFSAYYLWWGFSTYFAAAPGTIVCLYYFLRSKETWKKILLGIGTAICFSVFVTNLYPAWQVPLGYMFLAIGVWFLHENWDKIKKLKKKDWIIVGGSIVFMCALIISYLLSITDYLEVIGQTAYPGERVDKGSYFLNKLFYYAQAPFYAYKDIGNPCEASVFFSFFPIPTVMAAYCWLKEKKKDWLTGGLLLAQIPMLIYVTTGFPEWLAKLLLLSNSTVFRLVDIIGFMQVYFIVILLSRYENTKKLPLYIAGLIGGVTSGISIYVSNKMFPEYMNYFQKVFMFILIAVLMVGLMIRLTEKAKTILLLTFIGLSLATGICIRPVMKGFDALFAKPVANEIQQICSEDPDAKWLTYGGGTVSSAYTLACGAPTINSVNTYPNLELWSLLDEDGEYEEIYNRYAHVAVNFTKEETSFVKIQEDCFQLNLSYEDIEKTEAEYLFVMGNSVVPGGENPYVEFEKLYEEENASIYRVNYLTQ